MYDFSGISTEDLKEAVNGQHICSVCELSGLQCNLDYQEKNNMGSCQDGYYFKEKK